MAEKPFLSEKPFLAKKKQISSILIDCHSGQKAISGQQAISGRIAISGHKAFSGHEGQTLSNNLASYTLNNLYPILVGPILVKCRDAKIQIYWASPLISVLILKISLIKAIALISFSNIYYFHFKFMNLPGLSFQAYLFRRP